MDTKEIEENIKNTETKLEALEAQREELESKVQKQREAVRILTRLVKDTKALEEKMK